MEWGQVVTAVAETVQGAAETATTASGTPPVPANPPGEGLSPTILAAISGVIGAIIGAIITVAGTFLYRWYSRRTGKREDTRRLATDEDHYREWITTQHRFLNITGLRTRAPVEIVQNDRDNARLHNTIVAQITSNLRRAIEASHLLIEQIRPRVNKLACFMIPSYPARIWPPCMRIGLIA